MTNFAKRQYSYVVSAPGGPFAFVAHPHLRGLWVRTHPAVLVVDCDCCAAKKGEPCRGKGGDVFSGAHYSRKRAGKKAVAELQRFAISVVR